MEKFWVFIPVFSLLVFVHELGHFLFAKRAGILVREFAIGFGPKLFGWQKGETLYSFRIFPLGGFVRMAGEDAETLEFKTGAPVVCEVGPHGKITHVFFHDPGDRRIDRRVAGKVTDADPEKELYLVLEDESGRETRYELDADAWIHYDPKNRVQIAPADRQFGSKSAGQKAMAILAGPLFNILLTILLFAVYVGMTGVEDRLVVGSVVPNTPAEKAGIVGGDVILAVNGEKVNTTDSLRYKLLDSKGQTVTVTVERDGNNLDLPVTPQKTGEAYTIGVQFYVDQTRRDATFSESVVAGFKLTWEWTGVIIDGFAKLVTGQLSIQSLGGPIQMGDITGKAAEAGMAPLIKWTALLSLNLGIFNLLPIPALDGSRLVFIGLEAVRGKPVSPSKESLVHFVGFALLMMLMLVVTFNDIRKIFFA
ncbi:RIP metalloprotease RseP [Staphylospora marina]|uniref:RIP metalloprotease RseP n=1 Tax=Staphylospora marina TaxID=2490858 RepID=UPI0013DE09BB|nr:RIP metalloprotease RseP [Staphylospora marina]